MRVFKHSYKSKDIAVIEVLPSDTPPVRYKQVVYIRTGPSRSIATAEEERRLSERRVDRARTWDLEPCRDATLADLSEDVFKFVYLPSAVSKEVIAENGRSFEDQLLSLRLFHPRYRVPTNGAVVLLGKDPLNFFAGAYAQYVRYEGVIRGGLVKAERRFSGDLATMLRDLDQLGKTLESLHPVRRKDLREEIYAEYPAIALHELLVNAIIHRNYDGSTSQVMINHFEDRIEIQSPGGLYGDLTDATFPIGTAYRNPVLAEAARLLGFANRFGSGITRATGALLANGSPPLEYKLFPSYVFMTLRPRREASSARTI